MVVQFMHSESVAMENENVDLDLPGFEDDGMFDCDNRVKSFGGVGKWFESGPSNKKDMAKAGIFVPDEEHRQRKSVKCVYCRHSFLDWTRNDDPQERHKAESPECLFMKFGKLEHELTIRELLQLQKYASLQKVMQEKEVQIAELKAAFEDSRREYFTA